MILKRPQYNYPYSPCHLILLIILIYGFSRVKLRNSFKTDPYTLLGLYSCTWERAATLCVMLPAPVSVLV